MPWFYVDDGFSDSKPVLDMPDRYRLAACGLWTLAGSWSAKEELDGFVPDSKLKTLGARPPILAALTEPGPMSAPLCARVEGGIQFNSWGKWQKTRADLKEKRREDAERQRAWREAHPDAKKPSKVRGRNALTSADTDSSQRDATVTDAVTDDVTDDVSRCDASRAPARGPDPTRPDPTQVSTSPGDVPDEALVSRSTDTARGARLPDGWEPSTAVIAQMRADHPRVDIKAEHSKFIDYWHDQPGAKGRKVDWTGTWRNWIRRADEQQPARNGATNGTRIPASDAAFAQAQALKTTTENRLGIE